MTDIHVVLNEVLFLLTSPTCLVMYITVYVLQDHIDNDNSMILTVMTYVGCGLSILGCLITVIIFEFFRYRKTN